MFMFPKVLFDLYCSIKALKLYLGWSGKPIMSPVVLKLLQTRRLKKYNFNCRHLRVRRAKCQTAYMYDSN